MRTFEQIRTDVGVATEINDAATLMRLAGELDELATPEAKTVAYGTRGVACYCTGDFPAALEHYNSALALYHELGNRSGVARVTGNIGNGYNITGNYPAALEHFNKALALFHELGDRRGVVISTGNIGNVYNNTGNYPAALEHFNRALALHHELGDPSGVAHVTGNIGNGYNTTGDFTAALEHYNSALALFHELGDRRGVAITTGNIGNVYNNTGDYPAALEHLNSALALFHELGDRRGVARVTGKILHALLRADDIDGARRTLAALDELVVDNPVTAIECETDRAMIFVLDDDLQAAHTSLTNALELAKTHGLRAMQADVFKELRDLAQKRNDFAAYIEFNNEYTRINEETRGADAKLKIAMQAKEREIAEKDKETAKHMAVLHSTLPKHIADRVARGEVVNDHYDNAAVLFLDIVGFTTISDRIPAGHVVHLLDQIFTALDVLCDRHDVTKIKTIGDSYMAVGFENNTAERMAQCALDMITTLDDMVITMPPALGDTSWTNDVGDIRVRIGLHVGPVTAGVIGTQRMQYDVWGDTVNIASRMESTSEAGRVQVSHAFVDAIGLEQDTRFVERGEIDIKGKGLMTTYWLERT